jgi:aspartate/methionine/tyrosine aminotransferase
MVAYGIGITHACSLVLDPLTNVKVYCIFSAISKGATAKQGLKNGSLLFDNKELWSHIEEVFKECR